MLFNSYPFVLLVFVTFVIYYLPRWQALQLYVLIFASFTFYGFHQPYLLLLLIASASVNAIASYSIYQTSNLSRQYVFALVGVLFNLLVLSSFKYNGMLTGLIVDDINSLDGMASVLVFLPLPIGISFYTFQGISLLIDVYRQRKGDKLKWHIVIPTSFLHHYRDTLFFITFFPQLVAGPIVKAHDFLPQIGTKYFKDVDWNYTIRILILGYFLKMVVADNLQNQTFWLSFYDIQSTLTLLVIMFGYSVQIFADFAGYSLIAIGVASLYGYRLPQNFDFPYLSSSFSEFWKRWHMTLGLWLKEYLYIPLGGNRKGELRNYINLMIVMTLGGLWHGASLNFVFWGMFHGALLVLERFFLRYVHLPQNVGVTVVQTIVVFSFVSFGWLFFQLDMQGFFGLMHALVHNGSVNHNLGILAMVFFYTLPVVIYYVNHLLYGRSEYYKSLIDGKWPFVYGLMLFGIIFQSGNSNAFIYFQF